MAVHPEATAGLPTPVESLDWCADCAEAPCSHGVTAAEASYARLVSALDAEIDEYARTTRLLVILLAVTVALLVACAVVLAVAL